MTTLITTIASPSILWAPTLTEGSNLAGNMATPLGVPSREGGSRLDMREINDFFTRRLRDVDADVVKELDGELTRQIDGVELIASENIVSRAVLEAIGNVLTNKYAEGYPGRRYYGGCTYADGVESLAIARAMELFDASFVNVQPHSGASANIEVFFALLSPGDTFLSLALDAGGHLSHGAPPNVSGKWFKPVHYRVNAEGHLDYNAIAELARSHRPKMIIAGGSAYAGLIDFARFRAIADDVNALLMVDMAHFAGLVAGKAIASPLPHAHVVTSTTNKTLRGPRGGIILSNDPAIGKKINSAVFPGIQGGPQMNIIAAKAVAFKECLQPSFRRYARAVIDNAQALADVLKSEGIDIVGGGTQTHLMLVDLRKHNLTGALVQEVLEQAGITCNKNGVPQDPQKPTVTSGVRLGTPAITTRGMGVEESRMIGQHIATIIKALAASHSSASGSLGDGGANTTHDGYLTGVQPLIQQTRRSISKLCAQFPLYRDI